jgi:hypothetical protein
MSALGTWVADLRAAGKPVEDANGSGPGVNSLCPICGEKLWIRARDDGSCGARCATGCDPGRIADELRFARERNGTWTGEQTAGRSVDGARFVLDAPDHTPAVWGAGDEVLWASGEPCMLYAPQGVGKSTLAQQLILAAIGIGDRDVLGWPVQDDGRPVMLLAADRPMQIARSLRRMVTEQDRGTLASRLIVHPGPLPFDVAADTTLLAELVAAHGAAKLVIDSLKDITIGLTDDETGAAVNQALQHVVASGTEVLTLHHPRKSNAANPRPRTIDDVYGSTWLTAGHGSVLLLWGKPGDLVVELEHIKQPAGDVGRVPLVHDHDAGRTVRYRPLSLLELLARTPDGMTARDAAATLLGAYTKATRLDVRDVLSRNWKLGTVLGLVFGIALVRNVLADTATARPDGAYFVFELIWRGGIYGAIDALLLTVLPCLVVYRSVGGALVNWRRRLTYFAASLLLVLTITAVYHLGYAQYRDDGIGAPETGNTIISMPMLLSANPLGSIADHAAMHISAVAHEHETEVRLPPPTSAN